MFIIHDIKKFTLASNVVFSSNGVVFCVFASCWIESKINMTKKLKKFNNEICFALNDFIPETVRNNNTFFKQNVIKNRYIFLTL